MCNNNGLRLKGSHPFQARGLIKLKQRYPTTFDLRAILQKFAGHFRQKWCIKQQNRNIWNEKREE